MLTIEIIHKPDFEGLSNRMKGAIRGKFTKLVNQLHAKVVENVSGKILQKQTGDLARSIRKDIDTHHDPMIGDVYVHPATDKAKALEYGGKSYYMITPTKADVLRFMWGEKIVFSPYAHHPPSKEYRYLRQALEEMQSIAPIEMLEAIHDAISGMENVDEYE